MPSPIPRRRRIMPNSQPPARTIEERTALNERNIASVADALRELSQDIRHEREADRAEAQRSRAELAASIHSVREIVSQTQKANWPVYLGVLTFMAILISGGVKYIELSGMNQIAPLLAMAEVSRTERQQNREGLNDLGKKINDTAHEVGVMKANLGLQLIEVETQMRAMEQMSNARSAEVRMLMSELWFKNNGHHLPPITYFSDISRPKPSGN